jgi:hypothetical protein
MNSTINSLILLKFFIGIYRVQMNRHTDLHGGALTDISVRITGFSNFVHRPVFYKLENTFC